MREIKNNTNGAEIAKAKKTEIKPVNTEIVDKKITEESEKLNVADFSNPTEVLGRSQVSKADNLKADVAFGLANPKAITKADKFFEIALSQLKAKGDPEAYEKASSMASLYAKELV